MKLKTKSVSPEELTTDVKTYASCLKNNERLPYGFWDREDSRDHAIEIFRYLYTEILGACDPASIRKVPVSIFSKYKLTKAYAKFFGGNKDRLLADAFPDLEEMETTLDPVASYLTAYADGLELSRTFWDHRTSRDRAISIFRYLYLNLLRCSHPKDFINVTTSTLTTYLLDRPLQLFFRGNLTKLIRTCFPEFLVDYEPLMTAEEKILKYYLDNPESKISEIAKYFGVTRQRIEYVISKHERRKIPPALKPTIIEKLREGLSPTELASTYRIYAPSISNLKETLEERDRVERKLSQRERNKEESQQLYLEGLSSTTISKVLGISVGSVESYTSALREKRESLSDVDILSLRKQYLEHLHYSDLADPCELLGIPRRYVYDLEAERTRGLRLQLLESRDSDDFDPVSTLDIYSIVNDYLNGSTKEKLSEAYPHCSRRQLRSILSTLCSRSERTYSRILSLHIEGFDPLEISEHLSLSKQTTYAYLRLFRLRELEGLSIMLRDHI